DIVEVNSDAEPVGRFNDLDEFVFRSVFRRGGAALVFVAQIKRVEKIIADGENAAALCGRRKPQAGVPSLRNFRHFSDEVVPSHLEQFEHGLAAGAERKSHEKAETEKMEPARLRGAQTNRAKRGGYGTGRSERGKTLGTAVGLHKLQLVLSN